MNPERLQNIKNQAISTILEAKSEKELELLRIEYLGRNGEITKLIKGIPELGKEDRKTMGGLINEAKKIIEEAINSQKNNLQPQNNEKKDWFDFTIPGKKPIKGHLHLISQTIKEITEIFNCIGFKKVAYPEVEWDWYTFEGLNMPQNHPARDEWETFFVKDLSHPQYGNAVL